MVWLTLTPVTDRNKAVAVGAVSFHVNHFVTGRIAKFTYGAHSHVAYQSFNPEHVNREWKSYIDLAGNKRIPDHFETMLSRVRHLSPFLKLFYTIPLHYRVLGFWKTEKSANTLHV
jgi:hypothetical protein